MSLSAGLDIGSRSIELVIVKNGRAVHQGRLPTTFTPLRQCRALLDELSPELRPDLDPIRLTATGYGRKLAAQLAPALGLPEGAEVPTVTEIKAHAIGAAHRFPEARTVLDIGGQDTKAIALLPGGKVGRFEMNDRCAAGTGKFLEYTASVFQLPVEEFGEYAMRGSNPPVINSMCTVFAETEATSLMAGGAAPEAIALGLHLSIVRRTLNMLGRVGLNPPLVFVGGVARNACVRELLARELGLALGEGLLIPEDPDHTGALGAALIGAS